jgi:hypothetical protein
MTPTQPTWSAARAGEQLWFLGALATIRIPGEAVGGRDALIEFLFPHHASPPRHTHPQDESYVVLDGRLTIEAGFVRDGSVPATGPTLPPADAPRPTPDELERIFAAHGQVNVGPPLGPDD